MTIKDLGILIEQWNNSSIQEINKSIKKPSSEIIQSAIDIGLLNDLSYRTKYPKVTRYIRRLIKTRFKKSAGMNLVFNISIQDIVNTFNDQNGLCIISGIKVHFNMRDRTGVTASIDRINSSKGYTKDNIQIVHKKVNMLKYTLTTKELLSWVQKIYKYNFNKRKETPDVLKIEEYENYELTEWLTTSECAKKLNVSQSTIRNWIELGKLKCERTIGKHRRISIENIKPLQYE